MSRPVQPRAARRSRTFLLTAGVLCVLGVLALAIVATRAAAPTPAALTAPTAAHFVDVSGDHHAAAVTTRTLVIAGKGETLPGISGTNGVLMASLTQGQIPAGATQATVKTDTNCTPDQDGVSHCLNELDIGSAQLVVQHHHKMSTTPCLTPGETVKLATLTQYQNQS